MLDKRKDMARDIVQKFHLKFGFEALSRLAELLETRKVRHRTTFITEGDMVTNLYYVEKGLLRTFHIENDKEVTSAITHEGQFLICDDSVFTHHATQSTVRTIEPTIVHAINYHALCNRASQYPDIMRLLIAIMESVINDKNAYKQLLRTNAQQRYETMLVTAPEAIRRTPLKHVASYLHMAPETLSRIRTKKSNSLKH